jgi:predicted adenine nucleotide alpha hydrolase (AANH) superfamily ATPase
VSRPRVLVHVCCAPDALYVLRELGENSTVEAFFSNSNIHPEDEYARRLEETRKVARHLGVSLHEDVFDPEGWMALTRKFKDEPEKGRRCDVCYASRLLRTARKASDGGFDAFTTVMSLSPWKKAGVLNRIGRQFGNRFGIDFLEADFKKKDGFRKSIELGKSLGLYRQDYCGCLYSREARDRRRPAPRA